ncbi:hypothetical protein PHYBLDRAFT_174118 [Phycomyces blakesleeanus NRRL 1555(-)]|uniref:RRM domain-containing protein n=1 Tax=Phycomyces blakesleeanus (strain ATCC 8743b / DSM 1359 / FGSC 10004 / NBRC 33097 / NRRL 1555) TaxID=763407 RepID=A0A167K7J9_PHYB8|nr:hypothetical protein PHYBLDRAFT_174118 [Phycomyces blakesleeanus NRRL 1555(-)]OAD67427.1 hypothetical protein PHYBLDRAFT_174118 [Phycomyces blakesleeanus NRRL 1555(-)]|eukprot:XP_018285467.1 hypothetical protein PHYBLDRAFT_174118 [Phycomyces blakesleeanus NRRL 1555(-)]
MGELDSWMDENYVSQLWWSLGEQVTCRMGVDKFGASYAFVDFSSPEAASNVLMSYNGSLIPNTQKQFKLNWSNGGGSRYALHKVIWKFDDLTRGSSSSGHIDGPEFSIFCGDLGNDVDDQALLAAFQTRYASCKSAKVMTDIATGYSKGFGFVRFYDEADQLKALEEMQGAYVVSRPLRVSIATPRNRPTVLGAASTQTESYHQDTISTTVFVGGLNTPISEEELHACFMPFGEISYVKIPPNKGCGFVQFSQRESAEAAINDLNGSVLAGSKLRLSFGRSQLDRQFGFRPPTAPYSGYPTQFSFFSGGYPHTVSQPELIDPRESFSIEHQNRLYLKQQEETYERWDKEINTI